MKLKHPSYLVASGILGFCAGLFLSTSRLGPMVISLGLAFILFHAAFEIEDER